MEFLGSRDREDYGEYVAAWEAASPQVQKKVKALIEKATIQQRIVRREQEREQAIYEQIATLLNVTVDDLF